MEGTNLCLFYAMRIFQLFNKLNIPENTSLQKQAEHTVPQMMGSAKGPAPNTEVCTANLRVGSGCTLLSVSPKGHWKAKKQGGWVERQSTSS